jgi:hypothetical protein
MGLDASTAGGTGSPEIVRADPRQRRLAILTVLATAIVGAVAIHWVLPWAIESIERAVRGGMPRSVVCKSTLGVLCAFAFLVAGFGFWIARLGRSIVAAGRFPPPGQKVIRDTRVLTGRAAEALGRTQTLLGTALIVLAAALLVVASYGLAVLTR